MEIQALTEFFQWAVILSFLIYLFTAVMGLFLRDFMYRIHSRWFDIPRPTYDILIFAYIGFFKVLWILFVLVPYLSLLVIAA